MKKLNIKSKATRMSTFISHSVIVVVTAFLIFAGVVNLLDSVDKVILYPTAALVSWLLVKELL